MLGRSGRIGLVAVVAVVFGSAAPVAAGGFQAVSGTIFSAPLFGTGGAVRTLTGNVAPFGEITGLLTFTALGADGSYSATITLRASGGTVTGQVSGQFLSPTQYVEVVTLTGGTGAYQGSRGLVALAGQLDGEGNGTDQVLLGYVFLPWW